MFNFFLSWRYSRSANYSHVISRRLLRK